MQFTEGTSTSEAPTYPYFGKHGYGDLIVLFVAPNAGMCIRGLNGVTPREFRTDWSEGSYTRIAGTLEIPA